MLIRKAAALHIPPLAAWAPVLLAQFFIAIVIGYVTTRAIEFPFLRIRDAIFPARRKGAKGEGMPEELEVPAVGGQHAS